MITFPTALSGIGFSCLATSSTPASLCYFPLDWKIDKIIALPKLDKKYSFAESHPLIALLPILGRIFEKIILDRMLDS